LPTSFITANAPVMCARSWLAFAGWLALCFGAAAFGTLFAPGEWYAQLRKPSWNPPSWVFGPVWTVLYVMMAMSAWLVWRRGGFAANARPLGLFLLQLLFNALWSWLFFGLKNPALALLDIVLLWAGIMATMISFLRVRRSAGLLLVPYLAWVTFATVLNAVLWQMNR
jgi:tryptophan-rich sensory protein